MPDLEDEKLIAFCRELRAHGISVTLAEVVTAASALQVIDTIDRDEVFLSLRSVLTTSVDDFPVFEELFKRFWNRSQSPSVNAAHGQSRSPHQAAKGVGYFLEHWASSFSAGDQP